MPNTKASSWMPSTGNDRKMASTAPSPAPRDAEDVGRDQRVAEQALIGRTRRRERAPPISTAAAIRGSRTKNRTISRVERGQRDFAAQAVQEAPSAAAGEIG